MNLHKALRAVLVSVFLLSVACAAQAWKFASIADSRGDTESSPVQSVRLTRILNLINSENVDLVIFQGDAVLGSSNDTSLGTQLDTWKQVMSVLNCPYYISVGNHEIQGAGNEAVVRAKFVMPMNGPTGYEELVYSFDHQNAHFVCLDSDKWTQARHVQHSWLRSDLTGNTKPHIFTFAHEPAFPKGPYVGYCLDYYPQERDDFWAILGTYGCRMYFCGHEHFFSRYEKDGVIQVINGTCGVWAYTGYPGTVPIYHYVVVSINGNDVSCYAKDWNGVQLDSWSYSIGLDVASALGKPNGTAVTLMNKMVTAVFGSFLYVQEDNRSHGIRVIADPMPTVVTGDRVNVSGILGTIAGERALTGSATKVTP